MANIGVGHGSHLGAASSSGGTGAGDTAAAAAAAAAQTAAEHSSNHHIQDTHHQFFPEPWDNLQHSPVQHNDSLLHSSGATGSSSLWYDTWVVIYENRTDERTVVHRPRRMAVIYLGSLLAVWIVACCVYMFLTAARRPKLGRVRPLNLLIINFVFVELLMGVIVVPLNVNTELHGHWTLGPTLCRAWLLIQMFLSSLTLWSALMITGDRFVYVLRPYYYHRRMGTGRALGMVLLSWLIALATIVPPALQMYRDHDMIFEEVCAVSMTRQYAIGISLAAFFGPAFCGLLLTMAILVSALRMRHSRLKTPHHALFNADSQVLYNNSRCCGVGGGGREASSGSSIVDSSHFLSLVDTASVGNVAAAVVAANLSVVLMWAPFYVLNVMIPFCDGMCVDPEAWSACVWLGFASAGVSPLLWLIDTDLRHQAAGLARSCCCCLCERRKPKHYDAASVGTASTETGCGGPDSAALVPGETCVMTSSSSSSHHRPHHQHHNQSAHHPQYYCQGHHFQQDVHHDLQHQHDQQMAHHAHQQQRWAGTGSDDYDTMNHSTKPFLYLK